MTTSVLRGSTEFAFHFHLLAIILFFAERSNSDVAGVIRCSSKPNCMQLEVCSTIYYDTYFDIQVELNAPCECIFYQTDTLWKLCIGEDLIACNRSEISTFGYFDFEDDKVSVVVSANGIRIADAWFQLPVRVKFNKDNRELQSINCSRLSSSTSDRFQRTTTAWASGNRKSKTSPSTATTPTGHNIDSGADHQQRSTAALRGRGLGQPENVDPTNTSSEGHNFTIYIIGACAGLIVVSAIIAFIVLCLLVRQRKAKRISKQARTSNSGQSTTAINGTDDQHQYTSLGGNYEDTGLLYDGVSGGAQQLGRSSSTLKPNDLNASSSQSSGTRLNATKNPSSTKAQDSKGFQLPLYSVVDRPKMKVQVNPEVAGAVYSQVELKKNKKTKPDETDVKIAEVETKYGVEKERKSEEANKDEDGGDDEDENVYTIDNDYYGMIGASNKESV